MTIEALQPDSSEGQHVGHATGHRRRWVIRLVALGLSTLFALVLAEVGLRVLADVTDVPFYFWDPVIGIRRAPDQVGRYIKGRYINAPYSFNAQGWNYPRDYVVEKPAGKPRICVVGDSYVEALQVPYAETFFAVAEDRMSHSTRPAEWYAFGCSGFGTAQDYLTIRHYILDYQPDVVIMFMCANDFADCSPYLARQEPFQATFHIDNEGGLVLTPSHAYHPDPIRRFFANSALVRYFWIQNPIRPPSRAAPAAQGEFTREGAASLATDAGNRTETLERHRKTWVLVESLLEKCRDDCARGGARFAIAWRGNRQIVGAAETGKPFEPLPEERDPLCLGDRLSQAGDIMVRPIAERLAIPFLDLTPALVAKVRATGKIHDIPDDGHYNAVGHEAAGEALAAWVETLLGAPAGESPGGGAALKSGE